MTTLLFGPLNKFNTFQLHSIVLATKDCLLIRDNWNQETVVWHFQSTERKKKRCSPASTPDWLESQEGVQSLGIRISQLLVQPRYRFFLVLLSWLADVCKGRVLDIHHPDATAPSPHVSLYLLADSRYGQVCLPDDAGPVPLIDFPLLIG